MVSTKRKTQSQIIKKFKEIWGNRYDYSKVKYVNSTIKVEIICMVHGHGSFPMRPNHHGRKKNPSGCPKCYYQSNRMTLDEFLKRSQEKHRGTCDYSLFTTLPAVGEKVPIICTIHNLTFSQDPKSHAKGHTGCKECERLKQSGRQEDRGEIKTHQKLNQDFIQYAQKEHGDLYKYNKVDYQRSDTNVIILCHLHGAFEQSPNNHLRGRGCPKCATERRQEKAFKATCKKAGVDYHRALKRRQAGMSEEQIFNPEYIGDLRKTTPIIIEGVEYPNVEVLSTILKTHHGSTNSTATIRRRLEAGATTIAELIEVRNLGNKEKGLYIASRT
jgi:hypothetical protein